MDGVLISTLVKSYETQALQSERCVLVGQVLDTDTCKILA